MTINKNQNGESLTLFIGGRLDTTTAPELEAALDSSIDGVKSLTLDLSELDYISSAGLRVILKAQKAMNSKGNMRVTGVNDSIMEVFEITGFVDILSIEK
ncbi:MAG: STAS domain-containing protein [Eubacteriales bacterium]